MGTLILLLCSLPPLGVLTVAVLHGLRTGSSTVLAMLAVTALVLTGSAMLPMMRDAEPVQSVRLAPPSSDDVASPRDAPDPFRWARHPGSQALYRSNAMRTG
jgi:hypothetical protein